jgi:hypothetical protein
VGQTGLIAVSLLGFLSVRALLRGYRQEFHISHDADGRSLAPGPERLAARLGGVEMDDRAGGRFAFAPRAPRELRAVAGFLRPSITTGAAGSRQDARWPARSTRPGEPPGQKHAALGEARAACGGWNRASTRGRRAAAAGGTRVWRDLAQRLKLRLRSSDLDQFDKQIAARSSEMMAGRLSPVQDPGCPRR